MDEVVKDSRGRAAMEETKRRHHMDPSMSTGGPDVITKTVVQGGKSSSAVDSSDAFGVVDPDIAYSLNKGKRWERVENPTEFIQPKDAAKISFVSASVPRSHGTITAVDPLVLSEQNLYGLRSARGGVDEYIETVDGDVVRRQAKSNRANLSSLEKNPGPGPRSRKEKRMEKEEAKLKKIQGEDEENSSSDEKTELHVRYLALQVKDKSGGESEGAWRRNQKRGRVVKNHQHRGRGEEEGDEEWQKELEDRLEEDYEAQLEGTEPLEHFHVEETTKGPSRKAKEDKDESINKETKEEREARNRMAIEKRAKKRIDYINDEHWKSILVKREELGGEWAKEEMFERAVSLLSSVAGPSTGREGESLQRRQFSYLCCVPSTFIIHKEESSPLLGLSANHCTFVRDLGTRMAFYKAPSYCCQKVPVLFTRDGWSIYVREFMQKMETTIYLPDHPVMVVTGCSVCGKEKVDHDGVFFGLPCGHVACDDCWVDHCSRKLKEGTTPVPCISSSCTDSLSLTQMSAILSDEAVDVYAERLWQKRRGEGAVICSGCRAMFTRDDSQGVVPSAVIRCQACEGRTCSDCGWRDHAPVNCRHFLLYLQLQLVNFSVYRRYGELPDWSVLPERDDWPKQGQFAHQSISSASCVHGCANVKLIASKRNYRHWCPECGHDLDTSGSALKLTPRQFAECVRVHSTIEWKSHVREDGKEASTEKRTLNRLLEEAAHQVEMITLRKNLFLERQFKKKPTGPQKRELVKMEENLEAAFNNAVGHEVPIETRLPKLEEALNKLWQLHAELM